GMDSRLDGIDTRLDAMDARFDGMDARFDGMDTRFDGMDTRFDGMDTRLNQIEHGVGEVLRMLRGGRGIAPSGDGRGSHIAAAQLPPARAGDSDRPQQ
ncbi:hypothetical protein ABZV58_20915, partial [Nocardia sp. NPDC004654]|uniref:hypothetical protein n=1 Tax=Nocardia sp. NPDC004654 TaxID=3154776 RepID=UPI0033AD2369